MLSRSDILVHDRETVNYLQPRSEYYERSDLKLAGGEDLSQGFQVEQADVARVRDIMTPVIFSVPPDAPAKQVVNDLVELKVHRLFVVDRAGVLVGVISALDVLRHLQD